MIAARAGDLGHHASSRVLVIGESITDVIVTAESSTDSSGGSPLNVSIGLARLNTDVSFATRIGDDARGKVLEEHVRSSGVVLLSELVAGARSATAIATLDRSGSASYKFDIEWELPEISASAADLAFVHFGSIGAFLQTGAETVESFVASIRDTATICYDPNIRPQLLPSLGEVRESVLRHISLSDVVKASEEDIEWLYSGMDPETVALSWLEAGPSLVLITRGENGVFAATSGGIRIHCDSQSVSVSVIDTIGAGDAFMSGLINAIERLGLSGVESRAYLHSLTTEDLVTIVDRANTCGAIAVSRAGAQPPTSIELSQWSGLTSIKRN